MTSPKAPRLAPFLRLWKRERAAHAVTRAELTMVRRDLAASDDERRRLEVVVAAQARVIAELSGEWTEADRALLGWTGEGDG